ncbi:MAG: hypothetical protein M0Q21_05300 [Ignavibacteriaceae bacterium]|nr:hypothetical protein [Ignavibacteriaceae bacterium]
MQTELEQILISTYKDGMIAYMETHPEAFEEAIELAVSEKQPYAWRAAWLLWSCMEENDQRVQKHVKEIVNSVKSKNDGHQRELLKILLQMEINKKFEGILFNLCLTVWEEVNKTPSVRMTAFKFIIKLVKKHPELSKEISLLLQERYLESLSPIVKKSISKMMKEITY